MLATLADQAQGCGGDFPEADVIVQTGCQLRMQLVAAPAQLLAGPTIQPVSR